jgi:hypothetical protein
VCGLRDDDDPTITPTGGDHAHHPGHEQCGLRLRVLDAGVTDLDDAQRVSRAVCGF